MKSFLQVRLTSEYNKIIEILCDYYKITKSGLVKELLVSRYNELRKSNEIKE